MAKLAMNIKSGAVSQSADAAIEELIRERYDLIPYAHNILFYC
jgi:hypothetical protein